MTKKLYVVIHCPYCKKDTEQIPWDEAKEIYECPSCGRTPVIFIPNMMDAIEHLKDFRV